MRGSEGGEKIIPVAFCFQCFRMLLVSKLNISDNLPIVALEFFSAFKLSTEFNLSNVSTIQKIKLNITLSHLSIYYLTARNKWQPLVASEIQETLWGLKLNAKCSAVM